MSGRSRTALCKEHLLMSREGFLVIIFNPGGVPNISRGTNKQFLKCSGGLQGAEQPPNNIKTKTQ